MKTDIFQSYLMGGFECSTHRNRPGQRVDVIAATRHDHFARQDYQRLIDLHILTARDGVRWHLVEQNPYQYNWSSVIEQIRAARETRIQIIWDLFHYGYPDNLDIFDAEFVSRFTEFATKFVEILIAEGETKPLICLVNEISFFAWAAGEVGVFYPFQKHRGDELKRQLVRASIAAARKIKEIAPRTVLIQTDPAIRVLPRKPEYFLEAVNFHNAQYYALDALFGFAEPELDGGNDLIDIIGVNYYSYNQWRHPGGRKILRGHKDYLPFNEILRKFYARYQKPIFVAETGIEGDARPEWFGYVCDEVQIAKEAGIPILGICLYPIVNHPGWDNNRHCYNGLWDYPDEAGGREIYQPLAEEIRRQTALIYKTATV